MGLVLGPLVLFWLIISVHSVLIGYSLLSTVALFPNFLLIISTAIFSLLAYVYLGLNRFKKKKELWWCEITLWFVANKITFSIFLATILMYWFGADSHLGNLITIMTFIINFSISIGALVGVFISDAFMEKHKISRTH